MEQAKRIYLASSSPRRRKLVQSLGLSVELLGNDADETVPSDWSPHQVVEALSLRKAKAAVDKSRTGIIIGSDTVVAHDGKILGKPTNEAEAYDMLNNLSGEKHQVYSGIACIEVSSNSKDRVKLGIREREYTKKIVKHRVTDVYVKQLSSTQIKNYIATGEPMDKAGSYGIQGLGATLVESIDGDYFNVVGMSLSLLSDMLAEFEIRVL